MFELAKIVELLPSFALVLMRISGVMLTAPVFSATAIPVRVKALVVATITLVVFPLVSRKFFGVWGRTLGHILLVVMRSRNDGPTLERWGEQIDCAKLLGANIVADLQSLGIPDGSEVNGWDFAAEVVKLAEDNKVKLCLETGQLPTLKQVGEKFKSVWYCLDTGCTNLDPRFTFKQYVDELAERVAHLHLCDNYGKSDDHEPPGLQGGIPRENWDYLLNALSKYDNDVIGSFEMCPCTPSVMMRQAGEFLFDALKWPNRPQRQPGYAGVSYNLA